MAINDEPERDEDNAGASSHRSDRVLDARGLNCPLPVLRANKAMRALAAGEVLTVLATDAAAPKDFHAFCDTAGHELVESREGDGEYTIIVRKAGG